MKNDLLNALREKIQSEGITLKTIGNAIDRTESTASRKMSGELPITLSELKTILNLCKNQELKTGKTKIKL